MAKRKSDLFSFVAIMGAFAGRTLGKLDEDMKLLAWLTGEESLSTLSATKERYLFAREEVLAQFPKRFIEFHVDSCIEELDKLMQGDCDEKLLRMLIRGWLARMSARTKMDMEAYYPVKKGAKKNK